MAIDHFAVPAIYLVDLVRLLATPSAIATSEELARSWRCHAPFATALALAEAFLPSLRADSPPASRSYWAKRVIAAYGPLSPLSRPEQLLRKFGHFDTADGAVRYLLVQSIRNLRERLERRFRQRSARERLSL